MRPIAKRERLRAPTPTKGESATLLVDQVFDVLQSLDSRHLLTRLLNGGVHRHGLRLEEEEREQHANADADGNRDGIDRHCEARLVDCGTPALPVTTGWTRA